MTKHVVRVLLALLLIGGLAAALGNGAGAQTTGTLSGPTLTLSSTTVEPGQRIDVIFKDWEARLATVSVCGNLAKRGSADCNQVASQGVTLRGIGVTAPIISFVVTPPAGTCPCVIRATGTDTNEEALAPIDIIGHPIGPIVDPFSGNFLEVTVTPEAASNGIIASIRSQLGGATDYDVTVAVRNVTTETFDKVEVFGSVGHSTTEDQAIFRMKPEPIPGGQTWTSQTRVTLPSPAWGNYVWQVTASGGGPPVRTEVPMRVVPWLLIVLVVVLIADVVFIVARWLRRRAQRREDEMLADADGEGGENQAPPGPGATTGPPPVLVS